MEKKFPLIVGIIVIAAGITGVIAYKTIVTPKRQPSLVQQEQSEALPQVSSTVGVDVKKSTTKDNTVVLRISGLGNNYTLIRYELSYDSGGITQGVTSRPLDVSGKDTFIRDDIYLGTCSRNVCRPHLGVTKISVVLEFTDTSGKKSQFSKDYSF